MEIIFDQYFLASVFIQFKLFYKKGLQIMCKDFLLLLNLFLKIRIDRTTSLQEVVEKNINNPLDI